MSRHCKTLGLLIGMAALGSVASCGGPKQCPVGEELSGTVCVPIVCPSGQRLVGSACEADPGGECPGQPYIDECAEVTPRIEITVVDAAGKPVPNTLLFPFDNTLDKSKLDAAKYPSVDGTTTRQQYDACTNGQGKATICGWDPSKLPVSVLDVFAIHSGYSLGTNGKLTINAGDVLSLNITLQENAAATDEKVMLLSCDPSHRDAILFARENVKFAFAPASGVMDRLVKDSAAPLADFDTVFVGIDVNSRACFKDLVTSAAAFQDWIKAGGMFFMSQQNDSHWSKATGCSMSASVCPVDILPEAYRYDLLFEGPSPGGQNEFSSARITSPHSTVDGVTFSGWSYNELRQPTTNKTFVGYDVIDGDTVNNKGQNVWTIHVRGPADAAEITSKTAACGSCGTADRVVLQMEADLGQGKIFASHAAWIHGSEGALTGGKTDANAIKMKNQVMQYIKNYKK